MEETAENRRHRLPPPLLSMDSTTEIRIDKSWLELPYTQKVHLPLPRGAAAQNLVLCLLVSYKNPGDEDDPPGGPSISKSRRVRRLCRKIGINHGTRNRVLEHAFQGAKRWFEQHGGSLDYVTKDLEGRMVSEDGRIIFIAKNPKAINPRKRRNYASYEDYQRDLERKSAPKEARKAVHPRGLKLSRWDRNFLSNVSNQPSMSSAQFKTFQRIKAEANKNKK